MTYYPKSQVKTNLYTKGGEFQLKSTKQKYSGYYWKNSKGEIFTKKTPNVGGSELLELIPKISTPSINTVTYVEGNNVYNSLKKINIADSLLLPSYQKPSPTSKDYDLGNFNRFFAKKTNENLYIEVSKNVYGKLNQKNKAYDYKSYLIFKLLWTLTGNPTQVAETNKNIIILTEQTYGIIGLKNYLKFNYLEFYK
jgi:hypothetical protein